MLVEEGEAFIDFLPTDNTANELLGSRLWCLFVKGYYLIVPSLNKSS